MMMDISVMESNSVGVTRFKDMIKNQYESYVVCNHHVDLNCPMILSY